jgi:hypothetical protein
MMMIHRSRNNIVINKINGQWQDKTDQSKPDKTNAPDILIGAAVIAGLH